MMAKMFYTLEEAKSALGKSEEEIKQYAREGRLREFRDGPRLMFKADQVEQLRGEISGGGAGDQVDLGVSDSGGLIGLVDTTGASGTSITLTDEGGHGSVAGMRTKEDTALAADLGLSGSLGGVPSPARLSATSGPLSGTGLSGTASGSRAGINVFGVDDAEHVDPSAQTAITGGIREQINLEGVGSGSGLLDLSRDSDDTSLGAVLDEIGPSTPSRRGQMEMIDTGSLELDEPTGGVTRVSAPVYVQAPDPMAPAFGAAALGAGCVLLVAIYVLLSAVAGTHPELAQYFGEHPGQHGWYMAALFGFGLVLFFFIGGLLVGKTMSASRR
jgi:hypothetical protein